SSLVAVGRKEGTQQITVGAMQVDHVKTRLHDASSRCREARKYLLDVLCRHFAWSGDWVQRVAEHNGWGDWLSLRHIRRRLAPSHIQLQRNPGAFRMHGAGCP